MSKYGFLLNGTGMLNRQRTDPGVYEMLRSEFFILIGTPNEIFESANLIEEFTLRPQPVDQWNFDTDLEGWTLSRIRLDPSNAATSGTLDIDFIRVVEKVSMAISTASTPPLARIFPNPAKGYVVIEASTPSRLVVTTINGKVVRRIDSVKVRETISTSDWAPGIYIVRISNQEGIETLKLMVE